MPATETKLNIKPLGDRVVLEVLNDNEQSAGGIFIPDTAREKPQRGVIVAVGPGKLLENGNREQMSVKVGDKVLFAKYGGTDLKYGLKEVKILSEKDILGIIEE
ncbi:MAG: co-chaperone GroES [Cyanobacteria bacterium]|jgi:chaperonin GroES|nr:co-chaperone GroES [Cyanobacteriota bacterium]